MGDVAPDRERAPALLHEAAGFQREAPPEVPENEAANAIAELDAWDERGFLRARASLQRRHPAQAEFVFEGLKASTGAAAVEGVQTFLRRLDALESDPARAASREADHAALATLARRGIDADERARLTALVAQAQGIAPDAIDNSAQLKQTEAALITLYGWYREWSEVARSVVRSRRQLIYLGLARSRRTAKDNFEFED